MRLKKVFRLISLSRNGFGYLEKNADGQRFLQIETSPFIYTAYQFTGSYMIGKLFINGFAKKKMFIPLSHKS